MVFYAWYEQNDHTKKKHQKRTQESTIDLVLISSDILKHLVTCHVDEERERVLTSITTTKSITVNHESDHNSIETEFNIEWEETPTKTKLKYSTLMT